MAIITGGVWIPGMSGGDNAGYSVSGAGDVNGDGIADFIIGARFGDSLGLYWGGESYVVFGSASLGAEFDLSTLDGSNGFMISSGFAGWQLGNAVSYAGDVNNDGFSDVVVGAPDGSSAFVIYGSADLFPATIVTSALDGTNGTWLQGAGGLDGFRVSTAGDMNGDGIDDVAINAFRYNGDAGINYVVYGTPGGLGPQFNLSSLDGTHGFKITGEAYGDYSGFALSSGGDLNGDGLDDLVIGAWGATRDGQYQRGVAYVVYGSTDMPGTLPLGALDGTNGFTFSGLAAQNSAGYAVGLLGDVNGDGRDDIALSAPGADPDGRWNAGAVYVIYGQDTNLPAQMNPDMLDGSNGFTIIGASGNEIGSVVSGEVDMNGDGIDDIIISSYKASPDGRSNAGEVYVVFGEESGFPLKVDLTQLDGQNGYVIEGVWAGDYFGYAAAGAGDVNADGYGDIIVGALGQFTVSAGNSYLIYGGIDRLAALDAVDGVIDGRLEAANLGAPLDLPPIAENDSIIGNEDVVVSGNVLADNGNGVDSDPNGEPLIVSAVNGVATNVGAMLSLASGAHLTVNQDGTFSYDPISAFDHLQSGQSAVETFNYSVSDTGGATRTATVTLTIDGVNDAPVAHNDTASVYEDGETLNLWGLVLGNDTDVEGDARTITAVNTAGTLGTVVFDPTTESLVFRADADALDGLLPGQTLHTQFTYTITDGHGGVSQAAVDMTVTGVAEPTKGGVFVGGSGDSVLQGGDAAEKLNASTGNDLLNGGGGKDTLNGGAGSDTFQFYPHCGRDVINGFEVGQDVIDARGVLGLATHAQVFAFFDTNGDGVVSAADDQSYTKTGALVLEFDGDRVDGNAANSVQLTGIGALTLANFNFLFDA